MSNDVNQLANTIIHALDSVAQEQQDDGRQHLGDALASIACRIQRAVAAPGAAPMENMGAPTEPRTVILPAGAGHEVTQIVSKFMREQDALIAERDSARRKEAIAVARAQCAEQIAKTRLEIIANIAQITGDTVQYGNHTLRGSVVNAVQRMKDSLNEQQARAERAEKEAEEQRARARSAQSDYIKASIKIHELREALRTTLIPLDLLTRHTGRFTPEPGQMERMHALAKGQS